MKLTCEVINRTRAPIIRFQIADQTGELWVDPLEYLAHCSRSSFKEALGALYYLHPWKTRTLSSKKDCYVSALHLPNKEIVYQFEFSSFYSSYCFDEEAKVLIEASSIGRDDSVFELSYQTSPRGQSRFHKRFVVRLCYRDLCRVIVSAFDRAIKKYGFLGLGNDVIGNDEVVMRHFLFLKAYLFDRLEELETTTTNEEPRSNFLKECELLMAPLE